MARPPYALHRVIARNVELVTPHLKRITIDGSQLASYRPDLPAQWLKVFVAADDGGALVGRAYTIRHFDQETKDMQLDFVLHGEGGPLSAWAARVEVGTAFDVSDPHPRSGVPIMHQHTRYLLAGDATALPAIASILKALPAHAHADVFVDIADRSDEQPLTSRATTQIRWLHHGSGAANSGLISAVTSCPPPGLDTLVFMAAEARIVQAIRRHATQVWQMDRANLHAAGYWKWGDADHHDEAAAG